MLFPLCVRLTPRRAACGRPRERIHRPQTRRRKENNDEAMEKMRLIQANLGKARDLVETLLRRERKKRDLVVRFRFLVLSASSRTIWLS